MGGRLNRTIMSNKRDLKKSINYICSDLFAECVAASLYNGNPNEENVNALLKSIIEVHSDFVSRISHPEAGMKGGKFYKTLVAEFDQQVAELVDQIGNLQ